MGQNKKIIFIGTGEFAQIILINLINARWKPSLVISQPDKPAGRRKEIKPSPVAQIALENKLSLKQPLKILEIFEEIKKIKPDLIVVADYGQIIPAKILSIPSFGSINLHPSLLPKYRGPSPIETTLLNLDKFTGITIILMDEKMDHGPIIAQEKIKIGGDDNYLILQKKLAQIGADLLIKTLPSLFVGQIKPQEQNDQLATYTKIISKEDGQIDWALSAQEIDAQIRAFYPWPAAWTIWPITMGKTKTLKIIKAEVSEIALNQHQLGQVFKGHEDKIVVRCCTGNLIIEKVQLEGKKEMNIYEFIRGHRNFIDSVLQ